MINTQQDPPELFIRGQSAELILSEEEAFWKMVQAAFCYDIERKGTKGFSRSNDYTQRTSQTSYSRI
jgi:hypothetical protein